MRILADQINKYRVRSGPLASDDSFGFDGAFLVPLAVGVVAVVICSEGMGWDHVSASLPDRCLTWDEMCRIKDLFWREDECVMQLHPPKNDYVNRHPYCLHLWRPQKQEIPLPPKEMVG